MYLSTCMLNNAWCNYKNCNQNMMMMTPNHAKDKELSTAGKVLAVIVLIFALIFFILEVLVLVYAVVIALRCGKSGPEKVVHLVLAVTFTLPYMLIMTVFSPCGKRVLRK
jgi:hypothetical protein